MTKIYEIEFIEYTNAIENHVADRIKGDYLNVEHPFLLAEEDLPKFLRFGIKSSKFVGNLHKEKK